MLDITKLHIANQKIAELILSDRELPIGGFSVLPEDYEEMATPSTSFTNFKNARLRIDWMKEPTVKELRRLEEKLSKNGVSRSSKVYRTLYSLPINKQQDFILKVISHLIAENDMTEIELKLSIAAEEQLQGKIEEEISSEDPENAKEIINDNSKRDDGTNGSGSNRKDS